MSQFTASPAAGARRPVARTLSVLAFGLPALLLILAAVLTGSSTTRADEPRHQVWVLATVADNGDGETVKVQIPIEWLAHGATHLSECETEGKSIDARQFYETYKDLPPGQEKLVDTLDCHGSMVTIRVANREVGHGPAASRLHVTVRNESKDGNDVDIAVPFSALSSLGSMLGNKWLSIEDADSSQAEDLERAAKKIEPAITDLLRSLPPFQLVEVKGREGTVVVRSE
jgi:hypothetical protein